MTNVLDRFNRADGAVGNADSGQLWVPQAVDQGWIISGNALKRTGGPAFVHAINVVETGNSDGWVEATLVGTSGAGAFYIGLVGRVVNDNNHLLLQGLIGSGVYLYSKVGGGYNLWASYAFPLAFGDRIGLRVKGMIVAAYRNGVLLGSVDMVVAPSHAHSGATKWGVYNYTAGTAGLEDFNFKQPVKARNAANTGWDTGYVKRWDGAAWTPRTARRWSGTAWV